MRWTRETPETQEEARQAIIDISAFGTNRPARAIQDLESAIGRLLWVAQAEDYLKERGEEPTFDDRSRDYLERFLFWAREQRIALLELEQSDQNGRPV